MGKANCRKTHTLPTGNRLNKIKQKTTGQWKNEVISAVEKCNKAKLIANCTTSTAEGLKVNSKTQYIHKTLTDTIQIRKLRPELINLSKRRARTIIYARTRMLQCGQNYKATMTGLCAECKSPDDETHRLNNCGKWQETNNYNSVQKPDFNDIFSERTDVLDNIIMEIEKVWNMKFTNGRMMT